MTTRVLSIIATKVRVGDILECRDGVRRPITARVANPAMMGGLSIETSKTVHRYEADDVVTVQRNGSKRATAEDARDARNALAPGLRATRKQQLGLPKTMLERGENLAEHFYPSLTHSEALELAAREYTSIAGRVATKDSLRIARDKVLNAALRFASATLESSLTKG